MSFKCSRQFVCLQMQNQSLLRWLTLKHGRKSKATFTKIVLRVLGELGSKNFEIFVKVTSTIDWRRKTVRFLVPNLFKITWNWLWLRPASTIDWWRKKVRFCVQFSSRLREIDHDFVNNGSHPYCGQNVREISSKIREIPPVLAAENGAFCGSILFKKFVKFRGENLTELWARLVFEIWNSA